MSSLFRRIFSSGARAKEREERAEGATLPIQRELKSPPNEEDWPWAIGEKVGGSYTLRARLGRGGMGLVYLAEDELLGRTVAVKTPTGRFVDNQRAKETLTREVEHWMQLAHPNIVMAMDLKDNQTTEYRPLIVLEYCDGGSLLERLINGPPMSLEEKLDVLIQVCWAVEFAHENGKIHRDLKPGNVLLMKDGRAKVSDFGLVKALGSQQVASEGQAALPRHVSTACGTPRYMPPEQWAGKAEKASDVYALGVMICEIFRADGNVNAAPDLGMMDGRVLAILGNVVRESLLKSPSERASVSAILIALKKTYEMASGKRYDEVRATPAMLELSGMAKASRAWAFIRLGIGCARRGERHDAWRQFKQAVEIFAELGDRTGFPISLVNLAACYNDPQESLGVLKQAEEFCRKFGAPGDLAIVLEHQVDILRYLGRLQEALRLLDESDEILGREYSHAQRAASLSNRAQFLQDRGRHDDAIALLKEAEGISRQLKDRETLKRILNRQALIHVDCHRFEEAARLHKEIQGICHQLGDREELAVSLHNESLALSKLRRFDEAMKLCEECERLCRGLQDPPLFILGRNLDHQAQMLKDCGRFDEALTHQNESESILRRMGDRRGLARSLFCRGEILFKLGRLEAAFSSAKEGEVISRESGDESGLAINLSLQALLLRSSNLLEAAIELIEEPILISRRQPNRENLMHFLAFKAVALMEKGQMRAALDVLVEQETIARELGNQQSLASCQAHQAIAKKRAVTTPPPAKDGTVSVNRKSAN